jgi:single-stranded-DNA-specific exonuclease
VSRKPMPPLPVRQRRVDEAAASKLAGQGVEEIIARLYSSRAVTDVQEVKTAGKPLLSWRLLKGAAESAVILADAIKAREKIVIVADYDSDGATSCAICFLALKGMGARVEFEVPNRFRDGYGLTEPVVQRVHDDHHPSVIVTVDNGISSVAGIDLANALGIKVVVTDHHLPGDTIPKAASIANPNQPGCEFPSKSMAGCGVAFYVMAALREELKNRGELPDSSEPVQTLLDLVAIGTIADVVNLDENNRRLARMGLDRIRQGKARPGVAALFTVARRSMPRATSKDVGFAVGPRINAAGRLDDMSIGIRCLISDDFQEALELALQLDDLNTARKNIETGMQEEAADQVWNRDLSNAICVYDQSFHEGVIGIVAGRIKEREHRPTIVFAPAQEEGMIKGSGRSIPGFHFRHALDMIHKRKPYLLSKFGGHAMAAGLSIKKEHYDEFRHEFDAVASGLLTEDVLERYALTDGDLPGEWISLDLAERLATDVWGQGFPEPQFYSRFAVVSQKLIKDQHLKLELEKDGYIFQAMWFFQNQLFKASSIDAVYTIDAGEWRRETFAQLLISQASERDDEEASTANVDSLGQPAIGG